MKQVIQSVRTGVVSVTDVPTPRVGRGSVLVRVATSLISAGTERLMLDFAAKNLLQKARSRPDLVHQTMDKVRRDGLLTSVEAVQARLNQPMSLGYSCAGTVVEMGTDSPDLKVGDRVACAGAGYALHAELVVVPRTLIIKLPDPVDFESGAFTTVGAIGLQGIRLGDPKLGELVAVIGLGLVGLLTVQMLKASGCTVVGIDVQPSRAALASRLGADATATRPDELTARCAELSDGHGADVVIITADTKSSQPLELAGELARNKGVVVAVGAVGMTIPRKIYYEKELDFRISRSYGPGRYDPEYEEKGHDYPYAYVRWTEQRNMQAFANLGAMGKLDIRALVSHRFKVDDAPSAYELIVGRTGEPFLGVLLTYPTLARLETRVLLRPDSKPKRRSQTNQGAATDRVKLGVVGAGNFATMTLLPLVKTVSGVEFVGITSGRGLTARLAGERFGFSYCSSDFDALLGDPSINTLALLTRHDLHAQHVVAGLQAGKHLFVEKPLCLTEEELSTILRTYRGVAERSVDAGQREPLLMVDFNRRFAPFVIELKQHLGRVHEPLMLHYRVNAGYLPAHHWTQQPEEGGGRILGEACHFLDLLIYLAGSQAQRVTARALPNGGTYSNDNLLINLEFANGSLATLTYVANGDKSFGKESIEVFGGGLSARLDDFRTLRIHHGRIRVGRTARLRQDKGHRATWVALVSYLTANGPLPMSVGEVAHSTVATFAAQRSLKCGGPVHLDEHSDT